jgi:hypothetical protein
MKKRGRKTLCTPELTRRLCNFIAGACTIQTACEACGVSEKSFFEWLGRGERGEEPFSQFRASVMRVRGVAKAKIVRSILDYPDWRAKLEILARVFPNEYARTEPRVIVIQQPPPAPMPPPTTSVTHNWTKDANIPPELTKYLDLLQRAESISTQTKVSRTNNTGEEKAK